MGSDGSEEVHLYDYLRHPGEQLNRRNEITLKHNSFYESFRSSCKVDCSRCHVLYLFISMVTCALCIVLLILMAVKRFTEPKTNTSNGRGHIPETEFQVSVISDGCCDYSQSRRLQSIFFLAGSPVCLTWGATDDYFLRGFSFAVFSLPPGGAPKLESCRTYDTWDNVAESEKMMRFMDTIPTGRLVLISAMDDPIRFFTNSSKESMHRFYKASENIDKVSSRDSFALVGYTTAQGDCPPHWTKDALLPSLNGDGPFLRLDVTIASTWIC